MADPNDGEAVFEESYECDHPGCYSLVTIESGHKALATWDQLQAALKALKWLQRGKKWFCPGCRKAHE